MSNENIPVLNNYHKNNLNCYGYIDYSCVTTPNLTSIAFIFSQLIKEKKIIVDDLIILQTLLNNNRNSNWYKSHNDLYRNYISSDVITSFTMLNNSTITGTTINNSEFLDDFLKNLGKTKNNDDIIKIMVVLPLLEISLTTLNCSEKLNNNHSSKFRELRKYKKQIKITCDDKIKIIVDAITINKDIKFNTSSFCHDASNELIEMLPELLEMSNKNNNEKNMNNANNMNEEPPKKRKKYTSEDIDKVVELSPRVNKVDNTVIKEIPLHIAYLVMKIIKKICYFLFKFFNHHESNESSKMNTVIINGLEFTHKNTYQNYIANVKYISQELLIKILEVSIGLYYHNINWEYFVKNIFYLVKYEPSIAKFCYLYSHLFPYGYQFELDKYELDEN